MKEITDPGQQGHKKKTNDGHIHKKPTPAEKERYSRERVSLASIPPGGAAVKSQTAQ
jgi:hypothetical protein